jgi:predicted signal transduction protein with EAL and GGDEF domain
MRNLTVRNSFIVDVLDRIAAKDLTAAIADMGRNEIGQLDLETETARRVVWPASVHASQGYVSTRGTS